MQYFDVSAPRHSALCSDDACPCDNTSIPVGGGYLLIPRDCCEFRSDCPTEAQAEAKIDRIGRQRGQFIILGPGIAAPVLCCEVAARRRDLDMGIAAADAKHWWATGKVPYRPTPQAGQPEVDMSPGGRAAGSEAGSGCLVLIAALPIAALGVGAAIMFV